MTDIPSDVSAAGSASVSPSLGPSPQASPVRPISPVGSLTKIEIENYRGFRGRFELDLRNGYNLIVYGENGAWKSSLFHAINDFIESPDRKYCDSYFAGLKNSPASSYRLLLLDDILIGLDMAHRKNFIKIVEKHFSDWQIIILTYSKAWFERLKDQTKPWARSLLNLCSVELRRFHTSRD